MSSISSASSSSFIPPTALPIGDPSTPAEAASSSGIQSSFVIDDKELQKLEEKYFAEMTSLITDLKAKFDKNKAERSNIPAKTLLVDCAINTHKQAGTALAAIDNLMFTKIKALVVNGSPQNEDDLSKIQSNFNTAKSEFIKVQASAFHDLVFACDNLTYMLRIGNLRIEDLNKQIQTYKETQIKALNNLNNKPESQANTNS